MAIVPFPSDHPGHELAHVDPVDRLRMIVAGYLAGYSGLTRSAYASDIRDWAAWCQAAGLDPLEARRGHVELYLRTLEEQREHKASTLSRRVSTLNGLYGYAVVEGYLERNPVTHVRRPRVSGESPTLGLDRDEMIRYLAAAARARPAEHALICLLAVNGLRVSEACNASIEDLEESRGHLVLRIVGKGNKPAAVPLARRAHAAVTAAIGGRRAGPVLLDEAGGRLSRHQAYRIVVRLTRAIGVEKRIHPHSLRHSFVTAALDAGVPLHIVQDAARHADPRTTQKYNRARHRLDDHATYAVDDFLEDKDGDLPPDP